MSFGEVLIVYCSGFLSSLSSAIFGNEVVHYRERMVVELGYRTVTYKSNLVTGFKRKEEAHKRRMLAVPCLLMKTRYLVQACSKKADVSVGPRGTRQIFR